MEAMQPAQVVNRQNNIQTVDDAMNILFPDWTKQSMTWSMAERRALSMQGKKLTGFRGLYEKRQSLL